jgi:outer membrane protein assembly factor BamB
MRQQGVRIDTVDWVTIAADSPAAAAPTDTGVAGTWRAGVPRAGGLGAAAGPAPARVAADQNGANASLVSLLGLAPATAGGLLPGGADSASAVDAPLGLLLDDLRAEATRLIAADSACCNTVAVLVAGVGDPSLGSDELGEKAAAFLAIGGRRVPVYVIALAPTAAEAVQLQQVAQRSGGRYIEIAAAAVDAVAATDVVPEMAAAFNLAVQHAFANFADLNVAPSASLPTGPPSLFQTAAPVIGTVNLENAVDATGLLLPETRVYDAYGGLIPQRSNVLFTAGFELPGFLGRLSAYRVYRPVRDATQATGYRFTADGTRVWTAALPAPDLRNVFTVLPGAGLVPFRAESSALLAPYLGVTDPGALIEAVRARALGAIVNSTPALLEAPAAGYPDLDYLAFEQGHASRRTLVFVGADDGMMHAFDARTGLEVWAVVPFNLLPKLRLLREGASLDAYPFLVDGSPRLADVKVLGAWRTLLVFGEGPGGTFYQAFDVSLDGIADTIAPDRDNRSALLAWFADAARIPFAWSFPRYAQFDAALPPSGDLQAAATDAEKSVGQTWSTPAIGRVSGTNVFVVMVGSGPLPRSRELQVQRGGTKAGRRLYLLDAAAGAVRDSRDVGSDGVAEEQDSCATDSCGQLKNALAADPLAVASTSGEVSRVYAGDLDGRLWRFDLVTEGGSPAFAGQPRLLFAAGAGAPLFGSVALLAGPAGQAYLFLGTGSDLLPRIGVSGGARLIGLVESGGSVSVQFDRLLRTAAADGMDEAVAAAPVVAGSVVFFSTTSGRPASACASSEASLYALTVGGGVAYDVNGDGRRDTADGAVVARVVAGRAAGVTVADRHAFLAAGHRVEALGDPEGFDVGPGVVGIRVVSWRELR